MVQFEFQTLEIQIWDSVWNPNFEFDSCVLKIEAREDLQIQKVTKFQERQNGLEKQEKEMENNPANNMDQKQISCWWLKHAIGQAHTG